MQTTHWIRRGVVAVVWALAASTWASIAHHLFGMPDLVPLMAIAAVAVVFAWPTKRIPAQIAAPGTQKSSQHA
jgi:hypothetical protein